MNKELFEALNILEKEKGISKEYMIERIEAALISAFRKENGGYENARVKLDPVKQDVKLYKQLTVVEEVIDPQTEISLDDARAKSKRYKLGDVFEIELKTKTFGRIAAQAAKQVIIQGIREAERGKMIREYEEKQGEIISAVVIRVDPTTANATLEIGKNEMVLLRDDQIPNETLQVGDRIKVFINEIKKETKGPSVLLSRSHPGLVAKLFELALYNGHDRIYSSGQVGLATGNLTDYDTFDKLWDAYTAQVEYFTRYFCDLCNCGVDIRVANVAKLVKSCMTEACIERGLQLDEGGSVYNYGCVETAGHAAVGDSLYAMKKLVYDEKKISLETLDAALKANFEGYDEVKLLEVFKYIEENIVDDFTTPIINDVGAMMYYGKLTKYVNELPIYNISYICPSNGNSTSTVILVLTAFLFANTETTNVPACLNTISFVS